MSKITDIIDIVKEMNVLELKELVDTFCEEFGVSAAAPVAVAAAGPAVSLVLGGAGWLAAPFLFVLNPWLGIVADSLGWMNLWLGLFNLIPAYPMDGGRIFRALLSPRLGVVRATRIAAIVARVVAVLFAVRAVWPWFHGGQVRIFLLLIALFVYQSATAELRRTGGTQGP